MPRKLAWMGTIVLVLSRPSFFQPVLCFTSVAWVMFMGTLSGRVYPPSAFNLSDQFFSQLFIAILFPPCLPSSTFLSIVFRSILIASPLSLLFPAVFFSPSLLSLLHDRLWLQAASSCSAEIVVNSCLLFVVSRCSNLRRPLKISQKGFDTLTHFLLSNDSLWA